MANQGIQAGFVFNAEVFKLLFYIFGWNECIFPVAAEMYNTAEKGMGGAEGLDVLIHRFVLQLLDKLNADPGVGDLEWWHVVLLVAPGCFPAMTDSRWNLCRRMAT